MTAALIIAAFVLALSGNLGQAGLFVIGAFVWRRLA